MLLKVLTEMDLLLTDPWHLQQVVNTKLTIPNTGTGTSFSSTVNTKDMESITSASVAEEIAKNLRSGSMIASVSGKNSVSELPEAGDKLVVQFADQNYALTMLNNGRDAVPATATFTVSNADVQWRLLATVFI